MTASGLIYKSTVLYPGEINTSTVYNYLYEVEERISREIFGVECEPVVITNPSRELLLPDVYSQVYILYILARYELDCGDAERYEFYNGVFERLYSNYAACVNRSRTVEGEPVNYIKTV